MYKEIFECRVCKNKRLEKIIDLGYQALTGIFPSNNYDPVQKSPLVLVKCHGDNCCGLVQLKHTYQLDVLYGKNYGYRSGLNKSMVNHLHSKVDSILKKYNLQPQDLVIDIGSNDGTTLKFYPKYLDLLGVDPTGLKFKEYYPDYIELIPSFFSSSCIKKTKKAKVITSFSMFYDLEDPVSFVKDIEKVLADDGVWVFEQSYLPLMLKQNSFDTICQEHLEYYSLHQIDWILKKAGMKIIDVELNDIYGGSFSVTASKKDSDLSINKKTIKSILDAETRQGICDTLTPYEEFAKNVETIKLNLNEKINEILNEGKLIMGIGASTKGNVILQYCGINTEQIPYIGEINKEKIGCYTPQSFIPIISEAEVLRKKPDYCLVLPWHFKDFLKSLKSFKGTNLIFPLPEVEIVSL